MTADRPLWQWSAGALADAVAALFDLPEPDAETEA